MAEAESCVIICPNCNGTAIYRFGKLRSGQQRYRCVVCGRQFTLEHKKESVTFRPVCPSCGRKMHLYRREKSTLRFRCSFYPRCKTYLKISPGRMAR